MVYIHGPKPGSYFKISENRFNALGLLQSKISGILMSPSLLNFGFNGKIDKNQFNFINTTFVGTNEVGKISTAIQIVSAIPVFQTEVLVENNDFVLTPNEPTYNVGIDIAGNINNVVVVGNRFRSNAQWSIKLRGSEGKGNKFLDNKFAQTPSWAMPSSAGFFLKDFWDSSICSNINNAGSSAAAYIFAGKNFGTDFSGNITHASNLMYNSLRILNNSQSPGSLMGQQINNGNEWYFRVAFDVASQQFFLIRSLLINHNDEDDVVLLSKFEVSSQQSVFNPANGGYDFFSEFHPATVEVIPDSGTLEDVFFESKGTSENVECLDQLSAELSLDFVDEKIANGAFSTIISDSSSAWDAKRYLYSKIKNNEVYGNAHPLLQSFMTAAGNENVGKFYLVERAIDSSMTLSSDLDSIYNNLRTLSQSLEEEVMDVHDNNALSNLISQKIAIDSQILLVFESYSSQKMAYLLEAKQNLQSITTPTSFEASRKQILEILIDAQLFQGGEFTESQLHIIKSIAQSEHSNVGMASHFAISLLPQCEYHSFSVEEPLFTPSSLAERIKEYDSLPKTIVDRSQSVAIFPNPTSDYITLTLLKEESGFVEIYSMAGQLVFNSSVHAGDNVFKLNLPSGVYVIRTFLERGYIVSSKLIVK